MPVLELVATVIHHIRDNRAGEHLRKTNPGEGNGTSAVHRGGKFGREDGKQAPEPVEECLRVLEDEGGGCFHEKGVQQVYQGTALMNMRKRRRNYTQCRRSPILMGSGQARMHFRLSGAVHYVRTYLNQLVQLKRKVKQLAPTARRCICVKGKRRTRTSHHSLLVT